MNSVNPAPAPFPFALTSPSGLRFELNSNGSLRRMDHQDVMLNLFLGNELEGGLTNLYLRLHGAHLDYIPLFGPNSPATHLFSQNGFSAHGQWREIHFKVHLVLAQSSPAWFWHVEIQNHGSTPVTCDLIHTQDIGLAHYGAIRLNEFYVSQYIDHSPVLHPTRGYAIASRQNQAMDGKSPWTMIGSLTHAASFATDALQIYHHRNRAGRTIPGLTQGLPTKRLQHEHSMPSLQDASFYLAPGATSQRGFFGLFSPDHPLPTTADDLAVIDATLSLPEAKYIPFPAAAVTSTPTPSLFTTADLLVALDLDDSEILTHFGPSTLQPEFSNSRLLSFFTSHGSHVVTREKELTALRPHGHILRSGASLTPDESALTSTPWMGGVFHSMVTQGHVSINRFLSTCHTYLSLFRSHGQRVFFEQDGKWQLLGNPSAFEISQDFCRWIYKYENGTIEVKSSAPSEAHELTLSLSILEGPPTTFLITHHIALNGDDGSTHGVAQVTQKGESLCIAAVAESDVGRRFPQGGFSITPIPSESIAHTGGDELLFPDQRSREQPFLCIQTHRCLTFGLKIEANLVQSSTDHSADFWSTIGAKLRLQAPPTPLAEPAQSLAQIFPWFIHNALVHYLSPRGLEQYSGGGWGTRDVCQGPVELLLALGHFAPVRDLLCRVFRQQNPDGDWPQWFMFFERERNIRPADSHGDIIYWPILALAHYIKATGDQSILRENIPFFEPIAAPQTQTSTLLTHVDRALSLIATRVIKGTHLAAYGHGDWNDSLQPAKPEMRDQLCSSWTVTLNYQTFITLADAFASIGLSTRAHELQNKAEVILQQFQKHLIVEGTIAGLAFFSENNPTEYLLHPHDKTTGLSYSLLPIIHAIINGMLNPEQAKAHLDLIKSHLLGPDGARLFDRPMLYQGGIQKNFQRAETASYFGREIGIMYTHAHLRYCEALHHWGAPTEFFHALRQVNPIGIQELVSSAAPRQANCYYSSSDAAFADRYDAFENYHKIHQNQVPLEGGWRVYSSGAGIATRLIMQCFLGLRIEQSFLVLDPMMPASLDGLMINLNLANHPLTITYRIGPNGFGPIASFINEQELSFTRDPHPYRNGPIRISMTHFLSHLTGQSDHLIIQTD